MSGDLHGGGGAFPTFNAIIQQISIFTSSLHMHGCTKNQTINC